jgi:hypothetical protein
MEKIDWAKITAVLGADFAPEQVEWRPQGKTTPGARVQLIAYLTSAAIQDRLDNICGAGGWSFTWEPLVIADGEVRVAKGALTIFGVVKEDVGTASNWEPSKGAVTDALKRCASLWGIGRYLRRLPDVWVTLDAQGHISEATLAKLRDALQRRTVSVAVAAVA